ncbi:MAG: DUF1905 domain-containing protein [Patescibacteria group bacterium]
MGSGQGKSDHGQDILVYVHFPDKQSGSYLLPIKSEVRKKEKMGQGYTVDISLEIDR